MDLVKIGKYIAGKRKEQGLTQRQIAEQLGMSDKSVSKWERGICLPDVSVYMALCEILGISINEFLAGEDISEENIVRKSEDNLIQVTKDGNHRQRYLKQIIIALSVVAVISLIVLGGMVYRTVSQPKNYIVPVASDSVEMQTARLLSDEAEPLLFRYMANEEFETLNIYLTEYRNGTRISKDKVAEISHESSNLPLEGSIVLVPDYKNFTVKVIVVAAGKLSTSIPILEDVENRAYLIRSSSKIEEKTPLKYDTEQGLAALLYGGDKGLSIYPISDIEEGESGERNDFVYCFSFEFSK
jgi:transcriptional regulator with XRE-family HTH domain